MTVKSRAVLNTDADTNLADNVAGDISAADVRQRIKDLADSAFNLTTDTIATVPGAGTAAASATGDFATAAQGTTANAALPKAGGQMSGNITMAAAETVDGRDLSVDGTKLDGIEASATADQSAAEILAALLTVDGAASGLDADLLDGLSSGAFQPVDADLTSWAGVVRASGFDTWVATPSVANFAALLTDEPLTSGLGGTGNGFTKFTGPTTAEKTFTLPDASATLVYSGGALGTPSSGTLTNATGLPVAGIVASTSTALGVGSVELGHATDTTLSRSAAGKLAVENVDVVLLSGAQTLTGKTLTDPIITGAILEDIFTITDGAAFEIDPGNGSLQRVVLGASRTPAATNFANGESVTLMVDDGTAYAITWTTVAVVWVGGVAPTLETSGFTVIELWKEGNVIRGALVGGVAS